jgi:AcrR family transcriptional regulator
MRVFWEKGYEGTTLTDLTSAMNITRPSMYAAFGNKEQLFRSALDRYAAGPASYLEGALAAPTAHEVIRRMLEGAATATTLAESPAGCLIVQAALPASDANRPAHDMLVGRRNSAGDRLEERLSRAVDEGDLPPGARAADLARYVMTVAHGIAVQASNGVKRPELLEIAAIAARVAVSS